MYQFNELEMKAIVRDDLEPLRLLHNDPSTLDMLADITPVTPSMQEAWFEGLGDGKSRNYIIVKGDARIGFARIYDLDLINRNASIGLDVFTDYRGKGYGTKCMQLILKYCFEEVNLHMVYLTTASFNYIAQSLYKKLGFTNDGRISESIFRNGKYHDTYIMGLPKRAWSSRQTQPQDKS